MMKSCAPVVVFEDDEVLVVDKPGNMVCHSARRPGLAMWVRERGMEIPRFINRLDRETSGLVIAAKTERAAKNLGKQMLRHEIVKEYVAICLGEFTQESGVVDQPIGLTKDSVVFTKREVDPAGRSSVTEFAVRERLRGFTVVSLLPRTGRTHQLRVHMCWLGHSIVGDKVYGPDERLYLEFIEKGVTDVMLGKLLMPRHALHALRVVFRHPRTQLPMTCETALPADMTEFIARYG